MPESSAEHDESSPPASNEVEVSVFGVGVGECVVVHLGEGEWVIVDSCVEPGNKRPIALRYLESIGVEVASAVKLIVVTHWHDDHMRGASELVAAAPGAKIVCSAALRREEFFSSLAASKDPFVRPSGIDEMSAIFERLRQQASGQTRPQSVGPTWAMENMCLYRVTHRTHQAEITALSPSSGTFSLALHELSSLIAQAGQPKRRAVALSANRVAVVLWIEIGHLRILLGSDLETENDPNIGWSAVVTSTTRPTGQAQILKVPHHGSSTAEHPGIWENLVEPDPFAVVTSFTCGTKLPTESDLERLGTRTSRLYWTGKSEAQTPRARPSAVEKTLREVAKSRRLAEGRLGHVRLRVHSANDMPQIDVAPHSAKYRVG
ncbi:MAG: MBL fold metallo-hydrolase [Polyangiaceae bacterium]